MGRYQGHTHRIRRGQCGHDFARAILDSADQCDYPLDPIATFPRAAKPPPYGALANHRAAALGVTLRPWHAALQACLQPPHGP